MAYTLLLKTGDIFFFAFHIGLILFNLLAWIFRRTRKLNLITLCLTALSWFGLGIFYGWGYCFLTDWHWQIREKLGYAVTSNSYIHFLIQKILGVNLMENIVDALTLILFLTALLISIFVNIRDYRKTVS